MSVSSIFGSPVNWAPGASTAPSSKPVHGEIKTVPIGTGFGYDGLSIECSSRPQKKATAHHRKTRPRKSQPWDIRRKPTVYAPLPPLPPDWTLVSSCTAADGDATEAALPSTSALQEPVTSG
ncbi:unnamed protein product [Dovyalis caffra]|uniref:50S ribosomal protein 6, chloroplastic n=1 Tax=Dovyalis caffra TaxID=77055 RepID=A0AAV1S7G8_9ROSI|nr:unnamed protein product [Dovyalis caffra]